MRCYIDFSVAFSGTAMSKLFPLVSSFPSYYLVRFSLFPVLFLLPLCKGSGRHHPRPAHLGAKLWVAKSQNWTATEKPEILLHPISLTENCLCGDGFWPLLARLVCVPHDRVKWSSFINLQGWPSYKEYGKGLRKGMHWHEENCTETGANNFEVTYKI